VVGLLLPVIVILSLNKQRVDVMLYLHGLSLVGDGVGIGVVVSNE